MVEEKQLPSNVNQLLANLDNLNVIKIFRCFQMAISPNKMMLSFFAVLSLAFVGIIMDILSTNVIQANYETNKTPIKLSLYDTIPQTVNELDIYLGDSTQLQRFIDDKSTEACQGVYQTLCSFGIERLNSSTVNLVTLNLKNYYLDITYTIKALEWAFRYHTIYSVIYFSIAIVIIAFFGGAVTRAATLDFALNEKPGPSEVIRFSTKHFKDYLYAPVAPLLLSVFLGLIIAALGFIANFPWVGEIILGLLLLVAFFFGLLITLTLMGEIGGVSMMLPAISTEGTDGYDAIGRAYCYTYTKPWKLVFYAITAAYYGSICYLFVRFIAFVLLKSTYTFLQFGMFVESAQSSGIDKLSAIWPNPEFFNFLGPNTDISIQWSEKISALLVYFAVMLIICIIVSFVISFYFCASSVIYFLMRKTVDRVDLSQAYVEINNLEKIWAESNDIDINKESKSNVEKNDSHKEDQTLKSKENSIREDSCNENIPKPDTSHDDVNSTQE